MLNRIEIIGHLGRDPEVRTLPSGASVCNLAVATTEKWKDKNTGEQMSETEWHRVSCFDKLADICAQYLHKGSLVYMAGKLKTRKYTDKDGVERTSTEITCNEMKMLGGSPQQQPQQQASRQNPYPQGYQQQPQRQAAPPQPQRPQAQRQQAPAYQAPASTFDDEDSIPF